MNNQFTLDLSPDKKMLELIFNPHSKIPANEFKQILEQIKKCPNGYRYLPLALSDSKKWIFNITIMNLNELSKIELFQERILEISKELIPGLFMHPDPNEIIEFNHNTIPKQHQKWITSFLLQFPGNYLVFGGLGTGKTAIMAYLIKNRFPKKKILVVAPNKVIPVWPIELRKHAGISCTPKRGSTKKKRTENILKQSTLIYICNYKSLTPDIDALIEKKFDIVIFDESHKIKNPETYMSKAAFKIIETAEFIYGLTGTPRGNTHMDVMNQAKLVNPYVFGDNLYACEKYWFHKVGGFDMKRKILKNKKLNVNIMPEKDIYYSLLNVIHSERLDHFTNILYFKKEIDINTGKNVVRPELLDIFTRSLRSVAVYIPEDVLDLPPITFEERFCEMPAKIRDIYETAKNELVLYAEKYNLTLNSALTRDTKIIQITGGCCYGLEKEIIVQDPFKAELLADIIENEFEPWQRGLVWFQYIHNIELVSTILEKAGIPHVMVHGEMKDKEVEKNINEFKQNDKLKVLLTTTILKEGQTINETTITIFYDHWYSFLNWKQMYHRNYRLGQEKPVIVIDLITRDTIEEKKILPSLRDKARESKGLLNDLTVDEL